MGIELPLELRDLAERAGARWPEGDEDAMRRSAGAWRDAARSLDALAGRADGTARGALDAIEGETGRAARRKWDGFVDAESGHLPVSVRGCTAAADRLDHAAEQIGAAKVRIVRELVVLAKNRDAAQQAAAAGDHRALAGLTTLVRGASANLAEVHDTLTRSVDAGNGITLDPDAASPSRSLDGGAAADAARSTVEATGTVVTEPGRPASDAAAAVGGQVAGVTGETLAGAGQAAASPGADVAGERTGPVPAEAVARASGPSPGPVDAGTGPIPQVLREAVPGEAPAQPGSGGSSPKPDPASDTAPQAVHQAWAAPPAAAPAPPAPPSPYGTAAHGQSGSYAAPAPPPASGPAAGAARPVSPPAAAPPAGGVRPPGTAGPPPASARPPVAPVHGSPPGPGQAPRTAFRPGAAQTGGPVAPPHAGHPPAQADGVQRTRHAERDSAVLAFVLHQFPLGHMPVAASRPSLQWSTPRPDDDTACLRFPPQDHPEWALVDDAAALAAVRAGQVRPLAGDPVPAVEERPIPDELLDGYDPLADAEHAASAQSGQESSGEPAVLSEAEWERRYQLSPPFPHRAAEYVWPSWVGFAEGCLDPGDPTVLAAGTILDRVGDPSGRILFVDGTPFARRSLPPPHRECGYRRYRVVRALPVREAVTASWFGQPGGGRRYRTTYPVADLVALGCLAELVDQDTADDDATATTVRIPAGQVSDGQVSAGAGDDNAQAEREAQ